jgi:hypothetical protein
VIQTVHIDVGAILLTSLNGVYTDLVTRATGRTVRTRIEDQMAAGLPGTIAVIDFSSVGLLDFSCADEIVATLMRQCCSETPTHDHYLLFAGIKDAHLDAIEHVLERHRLALVVSFTQLGGTRLVGMVDEAEREVWEAVARLQPASVAAVAADIGMPDDDTGDRLAALHRRRLLMRDPGSFAAGHAVYRAPIGAVA